METPFKRDVVRELCEASHKKGIKIDLYFSHPDWYDADFRPYTYHPLQVPDADRLDFRDIEAFDAYTAYVLSIGEGESSRIYKTYDGGKSWKHTFAGKDERAAELHAARIAASDCRRKARTAVRTR